MSAQTPTAYIIVPIAQLPEKDGWYHLQGTLGIGAQYHFKDGHWQGQSAATLPFRFWLRPVDLSRMLEEAWEAGAQSESNCIKPEGDCGYDATQHEVDKINYLKSVLNHSK